MQIEHFPDDSIRITDNFETPKRIKEKLDGMTDEEREDFEDRIKNMVQSAMADAIYENKVINKAIEDAILSSWRMPHMTNPLTEPPFTPERLTYDGLGEYGKDWISLNDAPVIKVEEKKNANKTMEYRRRKAF